MNASEFLKDRRAWVTTRDRQRAEVQVHQGPHGGYGIYLLIDGYYGKGDAESMAEHFRQEVEGVLREEGILG
jgi:hypothetical protein